MITDTKQNNLIFWSFSLVALFEAIYSLHNLKIPVNSDDFFLLTYGSIFCLVFLYRKTKWKQDVPGDGLMAYYLLLIWNIITIARGAYTATGYTDWKNTIIQPTGGLSLLIPLAMMAGVNFLNAQRLLKLNIYIFLASFLTIPLALKYFNEFYPRHVVGVFFFILLIPYYKNKERLIIILVALAAVGIALSWRANVLRIGLCIAILGVYYFRKLITRSVLSFFQIMLFIIPLYYLNEGINGNSIFEKQASSEEVTITSNGEEEDLAADTRTGMYEEVLADLVTTDQLWFGKGSSGKYKTEYMITDLAFGDERGYIEVGFLKILLTSGITGMLLYGVLLVLAVYYGTWRTKNTLTKMMAMYLACHWLMLFLETTIDYSLYFFFSWIVVGVCFSKRIRALSDEDIKNWFSNTVTLKKIL